MGTTRITCIIEPDDKDGKRIRKASNFFGTPRMGDMVEIDEKEYTVVKRKWMFGKPNTHLQIHVRSKLMHHIGE